MAEGWAHHLIGDACWIESAGSMQHRVSTNAIAVMKEAGVDISKQQSKSFHDLPDDFVRDLDFIICLNSEEFNNRKIPDKAHRMHWPTVDPSSAMGNNDAVLKSFRVVRDEIKAKVEALASQIKAKK
jgi:arsenate reductase